MFLSEVPFFSLCVELEFLFANKWVTIGISSSSSWLVMDRWYFNIRWPFKEAIGLPSLAVHKGVTGCKIALDANPFFYANCVSEAAVRFLVGWKYLKLPPAVAKHTPLFVAPRPGWLTEGKGRRTLLVVRAQLNILRSDRESLHCPRAKQKYFSSTTTCIMTGSSGNRTFFGSAATTGLKWILLRISAIALHPHYYYFFFFPFYIVRGPTRRRRVVHRRFLQSEQAHS